MGAWSFMLGQWDNCTIGLPRHEVYAVLFFGLNSIILLNHDEYAIIIYATDFIVMRILLSNWQTYNA